MKNKLLKFFCLGVCSLLSGLNIGTAAFGQNMITLPSQSTTYTGYVRGLWLIAPTDFTIVGLRVPASAGSGTQSIQVMKIHSGGVAVYSSTGTNFTTLYYTNTGVNNVIQTVSIPVSAGDTIGILGQAGTTTSYGPSSPSPYPSDIDGQSVDLHRLIYQGNITSAPAPNYSSENTSSIGRIEVYYQVAPPDNAGIDSLLTPDENGNFCSGLQMVKVRLSNFGSNALSSVNIDWSVDGVLQTGQSLTFSSPIDSISSPNHDTIISLGYADFPFQTGVHLKAWVSAPNGVPDTDSSDDTLDLVVTANMETVATRVSPRDTAICSGTSVILDAGQQPAGSVFIWSDGAVTRKTSVNQVGDYSVIVQSSQGCFAYDTVKITALPEMIAGVFGAVDNGGRNFTFTPTGEQNVTGYLWDFGDGDTINLSSNIPQPHQYMQDGTYAVTLKESNPCDTVTLSKQIYVSITPNGIGEVKGLNASLSIYPNPAHDKLNISTLNQLQLEQLAVYNVLGAKIFSRQLHGVQAEISIATLPAGIYQLRIQTNKGMVSERLEVLR